MHKFCAKSRLNKEYIQKGYNPILAMLFQWKVENGKWKVISNGVKNASLRSSLPGWGGLGWGEVVGQVLRYFAQLKIENEKSKINLPSLKGEGEAVVEQMRNLRIRVREQSHFPLSIFHFPFPRGGAYAKH